MSISMGSDIIVLEGGGGGTTEDGGRGAAVVCSVSGKKHARLSRERVSI